MKSSKTFMLGSLLFISMTGLAQFPKSIAVPATDQKAESTADSTSMLLDKAISANTSGDKAATVQALSKSVESLNKTASGGTADFKSKLLGQVSNLKSLIPLAQSGALSGGVLQKAVGLVKMALGANQISSLLGGNSLLGKAAALTGNLNLIKGGLSLIGENSASAGAGSLISTALSNVSLLNTGGATAEPAVRSSLGGVLNMAKGLL